jgi:hypothetical protein
VHDENDYDGGDIDDDDDYVTFFVVDETFPQTHNLSKIGYSPVSSNLDLHVTQPYRLLFPTLRRVLLSK